MADTATTVVYCILRARWTGSRVPEYVSVMIRGNHDAENQMELRLPAGYICCRRIIRNRSRSTIWASWCMARAIRVVTFAKIWQPLIPTLLQGRINIGLLHTAVDGFGGSHERYAPCTVADLAAKNYDYWALGHVHERTEIAQAPWIVYPGNLQARHVNEAGSKGATLVTITGGRISDVKALAFDCRALDAIAD